MEEDGKASPVGSESEDLQCSLGFDGFEEGRRAWSRHTLFFR